MLAIGSDHVGFEYKKNIINFLVENKIFVIDFGCNGTCRTDYPVYGISVAKSVAAGHYSHGILICGTGVGMALAANSVAGVRAVSCSDPYTAKLSKEHNNTNILTLGSRVIGVELAKMIIMNWINARFMSGRHQERLNMFSN